MQLDVDIGSSAVANGVLGLVCGVLTSLVVDMAFLIQVIQHGAFPTFNTDIYLLFLLENVLHH